MSSAWNVVQLDESSVDSIFSPRVAHLTARPWLPLEPESSPPLAEEAPDSFQGIIGCSSAIRRVLSDAATVATTNSTVLVEGETGTGKERIAQAVHNLSPRRDKNFVRFNCAAVPAGLLESELFGHEKGAFTGAFMRKIGRFELADKGTLFLDEIGDLSLELQAKLLRVLQEQEFERLGSLHTQRVNVRLVAATNRNLKQMVAQKQFRSDLYFRLNVFPISIPPLRERREDIPLLVEAFVTECSGRMGRKIEAIPEDTIEALLEYSWPGNIRELQNFVERAVILSKGSVLCAPLESLKCFDVVPESKPITLKEAQSDHILNTLKETGGIIGGPLGAAQRLGMRRSTLYYKMRKLGISRRAASGK